MRGELFRPVRQVRGGGFGKTGAQGIVADALAGSVSVFAFRGEQWRAGPGVVFVEVAPDVLDEPAQGSVRAVDQRDHPLTGSAAAGAFADADVQLPEPAQLPLDVGQVEVA